jgi:uncharacterized membrane protein
MSALTRFLSRLIGLFLILVALSLAGRRQATVETLTALTHNPPLLLVLGIVFLCAGLAIVLSHNIWSGGALPVIITLIGWITLIRGLLLLFLAPETLAALLETAHLDRLFYVYVAITLVLGAYLTYGGFRAKQAGRLAITTSR